jgi:hypothetical protein
MSWPSGCNDWSKRIIHWRGRVGFSPPSQQTVGQGPTYAAAATGAFVCDTRSTISDAIKHATPEMMNASK